LFVTPAGYDRQVPNVDWGDVLSRVGPLAIGLGGLLLAGYQARLNARERAASQTGSYRERLYDKQLDGFTDIHNALNGLNGKVINVFTSLLPLHHGREPLPDDVRWGVRGHVQDEWQAFDAAQARWAIVIPRSVGTALAAYSNVLLAVTAPPDAGHYDVALVHHVDPSMPVAEAHAKVVAAMREAVGVEPLTGATLDLISGLGNRDKPPVSGSR
jgi:hypothetical protein